MKIAIQRRLLVKTGSSIKYFIEELNVVHAAFMYDFFIVIVFEKESK